MKESNSISMIRIFLYGVMALFLAGIIINCGGGGSSSGPAQAEAQTALIQDYAAKHGTMVDTSLADFHVTDEQPSIAAAIQKTIAKYMAGGGLEKLQNATFYFSICKKRLLERKRVMLRTHQPKFSRFLYTAATLSSKKTTAKPFRQMRRSFLLQSIIPGR